MIYHMKKTGRLEDDRGRIWARFRNARDSYGAVIAESEIVDMPEYALAVFKAHEKHVLNQQLSLVDELETKIESFDLWIVWEGEPERVKVWDIQIPEGGISFRLSKHEAP